MYMLFKCLIQVWLWETVLENTHSIMWEILLSNFLVGNIIHTCMFKLIISQVLYELSVKSMLEINQRETHLKTWNQMKSYQKINAFINERKEMIQRGKRELMVCIYWKLYVLLVCILCAF